MACFLFYQCSRGECTSCTRARWNATNGRTLSEMLLQHVSLAHVRFRYRCECIFRMVTDFLFVHFWFCLLVTPLWACAPCISGFYGPIYTPAASACLSLCEATRWVRVEIVPSARSLVCHKFDVLHGNGSLSNTQDRSPSSSQCSVTFSCWPADSRQTPLGHGLLILRYPRSIINRTGTSIDWTYSLVVVVVVVTAMVITFGFCDEGNGSRALRKDIW